MSLNKAEELIKDGKLEQAICVLTPIAMRVDEQFLKIYTKMGKLYMAAPIAKSLCKRNPSSSNIKLYFDLLIRMHDYKKALGLLERCRRFKSPGFLRWKSSKETEVKELQSHEQSSLWRESKITGLVMKFTKDPKQRTKLSRLGRAWYYHVSSYHDFHLKVKEEVLQVDNWSQAEAILNGKRARERLLYMPVKRLTLHQTYSVIDILKLPSLETLELCKCAIEVLIVERVQKLILNDAEFAEWRGDVESLRSLSILGPYQRISQNDFMNRLSGLRELDLDLTAVGMDNLYTILKMNAYTLERLTLRLRSFSSPNSFLSLKLTPARDLIIDVKRWNRIMPRMCELRCLTLDGCKFSSFEKDLKWPPLLTHLELKWVNLPSLFIPLPRALRAISLVDSFLRIKDVSGLQVAFVQNCDEDLKRKLIQAAKSGTLKVLAHPGLSSTDIKQVREAQMHCLVTVEKRSF